MSAIKYAVVDIETTGLDPDVDVILEVGCVLLDKDLVELHSFGMVGGAQADHVRQCLVGKPDSIVLDMHTRSGLLAELEPAPGKLVPSERSMVSALSSWLEEKFEEAPGPVTLVGSSVHFDIGFLDAKMPGFSGLFHYRRLDVSSVKVMVDNHLPALATLRQVCAKPQKLHRALPDCRDTIAELRFYTQTLGQAWS